MSIDVRKISLLGIFIIYKPSLEYPIIFNPKGQ